MISSTKANPSMEAAFSKKPGMRNMRGSGCSAPECCGRMTSRPGGPAIAGKPGPSAALPDSDDRDECGERVIGQVRAIEPGE